MFYPKFYRRYFILTTGLAIASIFFASCTPKSNSSTSQLVSQSTKTAVLKVGSRNTTTEDVLKFIQKEIASNQGLDFQIVTIADSVKINDALKSGEIDANFFQHEPFMKQKLNQLVVDPKLKDLSIITSRGRCLLCETLRERRATPTHLYFKLNTED
ncbi:MetQ/NlpA family ABC transporter substrate-binding protein [Nostoc commune]|uniref:MetQ/NlpA family ABC transporter substrate-binding protein n=1 Tax=Nostoc commune TaxID=1178 RepID=UPI0018C561FA|nr:MetQ/NlpA family ABC transporter substrate-binding protein [Nostoc commune]MBG1264534.1 hypothetical protein [Nostoc commune BAE]